MNQVLELTLPGILDVENTLLFISSSELAAMIRDRIGAEGTDTDTWEDRAGWDVRPILTDLSKRWTYSLDGLRDICAVLKLDWRAALPR